MATKISQKEYLKKYLSGDVGSDKKKKKKKSKDQDKHSVKIIDDDHNINNLNKMTDEELEMLTIGEDAPQIVGVIDDRPPELIAAEDYKKSFKWKSLSTVEETANVPVKVENQLKLNMSAKVAKSSRRYSSDSSPPRRPKETSMKESTIRTKSSRFRDASPMDHVQIKREKITPDLSPVRRRQGRNSSSPKQRSNSSDLSPPRKKRQRSRSPQSNRRRHRSCSNDLSPPRRSKAVKREHTESNLSPSRRPKSIKQENDDDLSPPRRNLRGNNDSDLSPPRQRQHRGHRDMFPRRQRNRSRSPHNRRSPNSHRRRRSFSTPPRKDRSNRNRSSSPSRPNRVEKATKTLDGKTAGLQDAKALREESDKFRKREDKLFKSMTNEMSDRSAEVVVRDRNTGKIRDLVVESEREREKMLKEQERQQIYNRWGKGLKQIEAHEARVESDLHESSKPLARYADDTDLDEMLRKQERAGDPMLEYLRSKEKTKKKGEPSKPIYQGSYPENRFSIRPGYRWDGVDRSNGYEQKWFNVQSSKKAGEEEAYKYSTEDM